MTQFGVFAFLTIILCAGCQPGGSDDGDGSDLLMKASSGGKSFEVYKLGHCSNDGATTVIYFEAPKQVKLSEKYFIYKRYKQSKTPNTLELGVSISVIPGTESDDFFNKPQKISGNGDAARAPAAGKLWVRAQHGNMFLSGYCGSINDPRSTTEVYAFPSSQGAPPKTLTVR